MKRMTQCLLLLLITVVVSPIDVRAADDAAARAKIVAPYVDEQTIAVAHIDLARIDVAAAFQQTAAVLNLSEDRRSQMTAVQNRFQDLIAKLKTAGASELYIPINLADFPLPGPFVIVPVAVGGNARAVADVMHGGRPGGPTGVPMRFEVCEPMGNVVFCGPKAILERIRGMKPVPRPELAAAFAATGEAAVQIALIPSDDQRRVLREMLPATPDGLTGRTIADGLRWAGIGLNSPPNLSLNVTLQSRDAQAAAELKRYWMESWKMLGQLPAIQKNLQQFDRLTTLITPRVEQDRLVIHLNQENGGAARFLESIVVRPVVQAREASHRQQCKNNLKHFGIALHNFHDTYDSFPAAYTVDKEGKRLLSWRVHVLPWLGEGPLHTQFHLNEPWDSDHNKKLIEKMPAVFACPSANLKKGMTTYLVPYGEGTVFFGTEGSQIKDMIDGTSNTILVLDVAPERAVIWTKPDDYQIDFDKPMDGLIHQHEGGFSALLGDGSVVFLKKSLDPQQLRRLFLKADREVVDLSSQR